MFFFDLSGKGGGLGLRSIAASRAPILRFHGWFHFVIVFAVVVVVDLVGPHGVRFFLCATVFVRHNLPAAVCMYIYSS